LSWQMISQGLMDVLASDHHGPRRAGVSPREALDTLIAHDELALATRAMVETPGLILGSKPLTSGFPG
jgi:tyrosine-protein phosphatase YwqE